MQFSSRKYVIVGIAIVLVLSAGGLMYLFLSKAPPDTPLIPIADTEPYVQQLCYGSYPKGYGSQDQLAYGFVIVSPAER